MASSTPPIGIRSIEITNFRGIDALRLDFRGPTEGASDIAVLAGTNGCGKTSVLEACLLLLGYEGGLQAAKGSDAVRYGSHDWTIRAEIQTPQGLYQVIRHAQGRALWHNLTTGVETPPVMIPCLYFSSWRTPKLVGPLPITAACPDQRPTDTEQDRLWRVKQHFIDTKGQDPMVHRDLQRLNAVWATLHPDSEEAFTVVPVNRASGAAIDVFLRSRNGHGIPVDALGSGQLELFVFFGTLIVAKFEEGILVIDEPELHLDPQWHALMLRTIRRFVPSAQLIVATHSPRVYDSVLSFQRHFLVPDNDPRAIPWNLQQREMPTA